MPRTITSTASGNALRKRDSRRFLRKLSIQNGRPHPAAKPKPSAANSPTPITVAMPNAPTPSEPAVTINRRFDQDSPACVSRTESGGRVAFFRFSSISLSVPSTCSRRVFCVVRAGPVTIGSERATLALRCSALRSPDRNG